MVTSFVLVVDRARLVAPDRIEIVEIDLDAVRVSGDETRLYNTNAPTDDTPTPPEKTDDEPAPAPVPDVTSEPASVPEPSLVNETVDVPPQKPVPTVPPKKVEDTPTPAPRKKTVVRVNRETVSLNRTMTVSVIDALRVAMTRCWVIDTNHPGIDDIRAVAHLTLRQNGTVRDVWFESAARADSDPAFAYVLDTVRAAINTCQPFKMLPASEFSTWEKIQLTFYPSQGRVM